MAKSNDKMVANNKKAYHDYFILDKIETGIALHGTEVKSLRMGKCSIKESFIRIENGEVFIYGMHISPYEKGNIFNKDPLRVRKLLLHKSEINNVLFNDQEFNIESVDAYTKIVTNKALKWNAEVAVEGDHFIENQTLKFAVRLTSFGDLPKKWDGFVFEKNNPNERIASFTNLDENVATFSLRGELGKIYQVQVKDEKGQQQTIDLPAVKSHAEYHRAARFVFPRFLRLRRLLCR